ncbi:hypothetical protein [Paenibacillus mucilaginosus]|uniref:Uncharacterized protein n=2 Tax=Paenibacillus mucilaginosus TaxID=61624 RepID=H6N8S2_9BACL|nr:hypothetical protein [Paenibacillus mucilaginosus]AFC27196.1 hypothetical protein PM3016_215 [Paenibacillus mucilaginosus 3016]AFH59338.1 hypothetical protein B2K_01095 [Paenibacillus mucilaginosus K02]MCG7217298.1 hypothetical protein [Paenibacillus mucilaginosus]WDM27943.1 hypothetical protein KCX80_01145 [Paenibacillus mucilaginosus]
MTYTELLERRSEILKRHLGSLILKDNQYGLNERESCMFRDLVKELHRNKYEWNESMK